MSASTSPSPHTASSEPDGPLTVISSDGHAGAVMEEYREYLDPEYREEFEEFLVQWKQKGSRNFDPPALQQRLDPGLIEEWREEFVDTGRLDAFYTDPNRRLQEMAKEGVAAEVLFPDFGIPFELYSKGLASALGLPPLDEPHKRAGMRAFNRWLVDYMSVAPHRFAGMAAISWQYDVDDAIAEIRWAADAGFRGIILPEFEPDFPLYHSKFAPIWQTISETGLLVNSHSGMSSTTNEVIKAPDVPHPACAARLYMPEVRFRLHHILNHLIWGGVLERYPDITVIFTETGSDWTLPALRQMDFLYDGSYYRTDLREVIRSKPSEYFRRQCYLGSSTFSRAEVAARRDIGIDRMMIGMDFPHHEGTLVNSTLEYLRATFGVEGVPVGETRRMLGETAAEVFGFDLEQLAPVAAEIDLRPSEVLRSPDRDLFPLGDVKRPPA